MGKTENRHSSPLRFKNYVLDFLTEADTLGLCFPVNWNCSTQCGAESSASERVIGSYFAVLPPKAFCKELETSLFHFQFQSAAT